MIVLFDSVNKSCPLLSPSDSTPMAEGAVFYSCSLHDEGLIPGELMSADFSAGQEMVEQEHYRADPQVSPRVSSTF